MCEFNLWTFIHKFLGKCQNSKLVCLENVSHSHTSLSSLAKARRLPLQE
jgi:hypothetical protein